ncbi:MAG: hypothetical protein WD275_06640 [Rhodothermales bacterium]
MKTRTRSETTSAWMVLLLTIWLASPVLAQRHLSPTHGGDGVPGTFPHSFVISWESVPRAIAYEYVLSDNPQCFSGCPGDTRQAFVSGTTAIEFNLQEDTWYYWITRVHFEGGDVGVWTNISSFLARTPNISSGIASVSPNPSTDQISVHVDWGIEPVARFVEMTLFDLLGRRVVGPLRLEKSSPRFEVFRITPGGLASGIYVARFVADGNPNNINNRRSQTVTIF